MRGHHVIAATLFALLSAQCTVLPQRQRVPIVYLDQGWTEHDRQSYYRTPQGMELLGMRYQWLLALERPVGSQRFAAPDHLAQFGFLIDDDPVGNPDQLPVGFTKHRDANTGDEMLDLACATCHSGQINYGGKGIRIDGGAAMHDMNQFLEALAVAQLTTYILPWKFDHFAQKVLGVRYPNGKRELRHAFASVLHTFLSQGITQWYHGQSLTQDGFGRTDALGRIGNTLFADRLQVPANYRRADAPVSIPHLWDIWLLDWAQWNGSIHQPMMRNAGTALGLDAPLMLVNADGELVPAAERYQSTVEVAALHCVETTLAQLQTPRWPEDVLGTIDRTKAARGKDLYDQHCASCHDPRVAEYHTGWHPPHSPAPTTMLPEWQVALFPVDQIGTDPRAADNFANRTADLSKLDPSDPALRHSSAADGLRYITSRVITRQYDELGLTAAQRAEFDGFGRPDEVRAPRMYRAAPLNGIWATSPYLHNGSVPNLYQLLLPAAQRDATFFVGNFEYDPKHVGYESTRFLGGFRFRTSGVGNANSGHEYGTDMSDADRWALVEYLKIVGEDAPLPAAPELPQCGPR
jgi:cytochrome c5